MPVYCEKEKLFGKTHLGFQKRRAICQALHFERSGRRILLGSGKSANVADHGKI